MSSVGRGGAKVAQDGQHPAVPGVALVPVVAAAEWTRPASQPRSNSIFVTHLIATVEQVPQTCSLRRASASDANAAYTANRHPIVTTGLRERQIV